MYQLYDFGGVRVFEQWRNDCPRYPRCKRTSKIARFALETHFFRYFTCVFSKIRTNLRGRGGKVSGGGPHVRFATVLNLGYRM